MRFVSVLLPAVLAGHVVGCAALDAGASVLSKARKDAAIANSAPFDVDDQSTFDWSGDLADDFRDFIDRHPKVKAAVLAGTAATSQLKIVHVHGCSGNCTETLAHWAARHADAIAAYGSGSVRGPTIDPVRSRREHGLRGATGQAKDSHN